jgi:hypothetical protein
MNYHYNRVYTFENQSLPLGFERIPFDQVPVQDSFQYQFDHSYRIDFETLTTWGLSYTHLDQYLYVGIPVWQVPPVPTGLTPPMFPGIEQPSMSDIPPINAIPEPSTYLLMSMSMVAAGLYRKWRTSRV